MLVILAIATYAVISHLNGLKIANIRIGDCVVKAEIADTPQTREKGLSGRKHLKANHGMLFVFDYIRRQVFWMKDARIPLSIAFIASDGTILQIEHMEPFDMDYVASESMPLKLTKAFFRTMGLPWEWMLI